jgi:hypothetical protein
MGAIGAIWMPKKWLYLSERCLIPGHPSKKTGQTIKI